MVAVVSSSCEFEDDQEQASHTKEVEAVTAASALVSSLIK